MNVAKAVTELSSMSEDVLEQITWKNAARFFGVSDEMAAARSAAE